MESLKGYICYLEHNNIDYYRLSLRERKVIKEMVLKGKSSDLEFNKKGHLIFRQRYPNFPLHFSIIALLISLICYGFIFVNM